MPRKKKETDSSVETKPRKTTAKPTPSRKKKSQNPIQSFYLAVSKNLAANRVLYAKYLAVIVIVLALGAFFYLKKDWFVAGMVNNQPITTLEYYQNLKAKDNKEVLNQIVRDKLITQEANKKGVVIKQEDLDKKVSEIEKQLGGKDQLKQALDSRNIGENEFRNQIRIQLIVEKLLEKEIAVSDKEVEDYIAKNKDNSGTLGVDINDKDAVREQLQNEKLNEKFQAWYEELQKNAKINLFI